MKSKTNHFLYFDILRIICIFFVIFNHTGDKGFLLFSAESLGSFKWCAYVLISILCKIAVPVFFMISGALLLPKKEPLHVIYKKRIPFICIVLLIASFCYYLTYEYPLFKDFSLYKFFFRLLCGDWNYSYWFLYAYIAYLVMLPILRLIFDNMDRNIFIYMIGLQIIFCGIIPIIMFIIFKQQTEINGFLYPHSIVSITFIYPLIGAFIHSHAPTPLRRKVVLLLMLSFLATNLSILMTWYKIKLMGFQDGPSMQFFENFSLLNSITLFYSVRYICNLCNNKILMKLFKLWGKLVFWIYLLHLFFMWKIFEPIYRFFSITLSLNRMFSSCISCFVLILTVSFLLLPFYAVIRFKTKLKGILKHARVVCFKG